MTAPTTPATTLVMATNNAHKLREIRQIMEPLGYRVASLAEIGCHDDIPETGDTLEQNAEQKARYVSEHYGYDCFADDTGLFVDALGGAPGVYTARYAGPGCTPAQNVDKLLSSLQGCDNRRAHFSTVIALLQGGKLTLHHGRVDGEITRGRLGTDGFGYDPVFRPEGHSATFAEMGPEGKNALSHRGRAVKALVSYLTGPGADAATK